MADSNKIKIGQFITILDLLLNEEKTVKLVTTENKTVYSSMGYKTKKYSHQELASGGNGRDSVSDISPLGKAIIGKKVGDIVKIIGGNGKECKYKIVAVSENSSGAEELPFEPTSSRRLSDSDIYSENKSITNNDTVKEEPILDANENVISVTQEDISYQEDKTEYKPVYKIANKYRNYIIVWVSGSGTTHAGQMATYRCLIEFNGHMKFIQDSMEGKSANKIMLAGVEAAIERINRPSKVCVVSYTTLGFTKAFKGKGANADIVEQIFVKLKEKNCTLTVCTCENHAEEIKKYILNNNPDKEAREALIKKDELAKNKRLRNYQQHLYDECIAKAEKILLENNVDPRIIEQIKAIKVDE